MSAAAHSSSAPSPDQVVRIRPVRPDDDPGLRAVAQLHAELLPFGPLAALGPDFLRAVCYRAPLRDGLLTVGLAEVDGAPAGFVACTADSERFHADAMRRHLVLAAAQLLRAVVLDPRRLRALPRIVRVMRSRVADEEDRSDVGEVIGVGVRPEYLAPAFRKRTGSWLSRDVIAWAAAELHRAGKRRLRMFVAAENTRTLLLYKVLGAGFTKVEHGGEPTMAVTFALPFGGNAG